MATDPTFAAAVHVGSGRCGSAETNLQSPTSAITLLTATAAGTKIERVTVEASSTSLTVTTVAGLVYLFLYDGTTHRLFDTISVTAISGSSTTQPFRATIGYGELIIPSGWSLKAAQSVSGNANLLEVFAFAGDF